MSCPLTRKRQGGERSGSSAADRGGGRDGWRGTSCGGISGQMSSARYGLPLIAAASSS